MAGKQFISRADIKFLLVILGVVVSGTFFMSALRSDINANTTMFSEIAKMVKETHDTVLVISTNQGHIMRELGIAVSD